MRRLPSFISRKRAVALVALLGFVAPLTAFAQSSTDDTRVKIYQFFGNILLGILQTVAQLVAMVTHFLIIIAQYSDFTRNEVVTKGWDIVISVANMFFVIALLVIALGTVLRVQNYRYNRLLGNVIVMAFLTNFSKTIAAFFIQSSQVVMLTFVNAFKDAAFGNFATMFGLDKVLTFSTIEPSGAIDVLAAVLIGLFFLTVALITILALAVVLAVRIVMLWILVILSPFAYAMRVIPNTEKWATQWWGEFGKWVTNGPVIAFFLWLALAILSQSNQAGGSPASFITSQASVKKAIEAIPPSETALFFGKTELLDLNNFVGFIVSIIFLWMGLQMAISTGGVAGKWAGKIAGAGLAAYGTVSLLNAVRDRTVAPIQGYLSQREQRRKQAITERTAGLTARVDQASSLTVGNVGRVGAAAGAGIRSIGSAVKAGDAGVITDAMMSGLRTGTRGEQQRQQRMEEFQQGRAARRAGEMDIANLDTQAVLGKAASGSDEDKYAATQELIRRNALNADDSYHQSLVQGAAQYAGDRKMGSEFRQNLEKLSPELAKQVLYHNFAGQADRDKYLEHVQQRSAALKLEKGDVESFGGTLGNEMVKYARNREDLEKMSGLLADTSAKEEAFKSLDLSSVAPNATIRERRNIAEVTGRYMAAFRNNDGTHMEDEMKQWVEATGSDTVAKTASHTDLSSSEGVQALKKSGLKFSGWIAIRKRDKKTAQAVSAGLKGWQDEMDSATPEGGDVQANEDWQFAAAQRFAANNGEVIDYNFGTAKGRELFEGVLENAKAEDVKSIDKSDFYKKATAEEKAYIHRAMAFNMPNPQLSALLLDENKTLSKSVLAEAQDVLDNKEKSAEKIPSTIANKLISMNSNPVLGRFMNAEKARVNKIKDDKAAMKAQGFAGLPTDPPGKPTPAKPLMDVDRDTFNRTKKAIAEYTALTGNAAGFWLDKNGGYNAASGVYLDRATFEAANQVAGYQAAHGISRVSGLKGLSGATGKKANRLGTDFRSMLGGRYADRAAIRMTDPKEIQEFATEYVGVLDEEYQAIESKIDKTAGDQVRMAQLKSARERMAKVVSDPSSMPELKILNTARVGQRAKTALAHEATHGKLDRIDPNGELRRQHLEALSPKDRQALVAEYRTKLKNPQLTDEQAFDEYLTEGLTNAFRPWADRSASAVTLSPETIEAFQDQALAAGEKPFMTSGVMLGGYGKNAKQVQTALAAAGYAGVAKGKGWLNTLVASTKATAGSLKENAIIAGMMGKEMVGEGARAVVGGAKSVIGGAQSIGQDVAMGAKMSADDIAKLPMLQRIGLSLGERSQRIRTDRQASKERKTAARAEKEKVSAMWDEAKAMDAQFDEQKRIAKLDERAAKAQEQYEKARARSARWQDDRVGTDSLAKEEDDRLASRVTHLSTKRDARVKQGKVAEANAFATKIAELETRREGLRQDQAIERRNYQVIAAKEEEQARIAAEKAVTKAADARRANAAKQSKPSSPVAVTTPTPASATPAATVASPQPTAIPEPPTAKSAGPTAAPKNRTRREERKDQVTQERADREARRDEQRRTGSAPRKQVVRTENVATARVPEVDRMISELESSVASSIDSLGLRLEGVMSQLASKAPEMQSQIEEVQRNLRTEMQSARTDPKSSAANVERIQREMLEQLKKLNKKEETRSSTFEI